MQLNFLRTFKFQETKMKSFLINTLIFLSFITSTIGKCPEDPLDCLIKSEIQENKLDIDSPSGEQTKVTTNEASLDGPEVDLSSDGKFSLNDTQPVGCGEDQTTSSGGKSCKKCSVCPKNGLLLRKCNSSQDTQCVCGKGSYLNVMNYECKPCSSCPHGFGVWRQCNRNRNTVCRKCPPGTYSGVLSGTLGCILCSTCRSDQVMLQECSRIQDTVCVGMSPTYIHFLSKSQTYPLSLSRSLLSHSSLLLHSFFLASFCDRKLHTFRYLGSFFFETHHTLSHL